MLSRVEGEGWAGLAAIRPTAPSLSSSVDMERMRASAQSLNPRLAARCSGVLPSRSRMSEIKENLLNQNKKNKFIIHDITKKITSYGHSRSFNAQTDKHIHQLSSCASKTFFL